MKPKKFEGRVYFEIKKMKENGTYFSAPLGTWKEKITEKQTHVRKFIQSAPHFSLSGPDEVEEVLWRLNEMTEHKTKFDMPLPDNSDEFLIEFPFGLTVHLDIADEYHGGGNSETYILLQGAVLTNDAITDDEIYEAIDWLKAIFDRK